ncbi:MAG TPA: hypothetical protein VI685_18110 [Candidatus Angelobacter sp.]
MEGLSEGTIRTGTVSKRTYRFLQQTVLSLVAAPPRKWSYVKPIVVSIVFYCLLRMSAAAWLGRPLGTLPGGGILVQLLFYVPVVAIAVITFWHNHWIHRRKLSAWERRFMCQDCGMIFSM